MSKYDLKLLDCTLRDGGYVNDWNWGYHVARAIIRGLTKANLDFVEVGFLRNVDEYNPDVTVCNKIEELNKLLPENTGSTIYSAMAMRSNYDIEKLTPYSGTGIKLIRVTAHEYDIEEGIEFAKKVMEKGYLVSVNPINIMGYSDEQILWIVERVNEIKPYQFAIVDTFGSMKRRDLDRIVSLIDNNMNRDIRVSLHLHENMSLSCCLAQQFVDKHLNRPVAIDGSLLGMGRTPGNLPVELIADYLNDYADKNYDIDFLMDTLQDFIAPLKGKSEWGYTPAYFLSAKYNLHRNYAEHYLSKGDLSNRDINHILAKFDKTKANSFDVEYADRIYTEYKNNIIDDSGDILKLKQEIQGRNIMLIAPGKSIGEKRDDIINYIESNKPIVIAINFIPENIDCDYAFFSNGKRFAQKPETKISLIVTSNIETNQNVYRINYDRLAKSLNKGFSSYVMVLKLLSELGVKEIGVAGADGFKSGEKNYYKASITDSINYANDYNMSIKEAIDSIDLKVNYITESEYE